MPLCGSGKSATCSKGQHQDSRRVSLISGQDTYIVLVNVPASDVLDAELVHADLDVLAGSIVARTGRKGSVDTVGMLNDMLVAIFQERL